MLCEEQASRFQLGLRLSDGVPYILFVEERAGDGECAEKSMWIKSPGNLYAMRVCDHFMEVDARSARRDRRAGPDIGEKVALREKVLEFEWSADGNAGTIRKHRF